MNPFLNKILSFIADVRQKDDAIEQAVDLELPSLEQELYKHQVINVEEDFVNRVLRTHFRNHWAIYSATVEFEPNDVVILTIITTWGNVINLSFVIEDLWFDDYTTSFLIKLDTGNIDAGGFILNTIIHALGNWLMSLFGVFFNPINLGKQIGTLRFEKNGAIQFELPPDSPVREFFPLPKRDINSLGPVIMGNPKTGQSVLSVDAYAFHEPLERFTVPEIPVKTSWLRSIDIMAVLLLPIGVWITFVILHHYLPAETIHFSFSTYFLISVGIFIISFLVMNIPRYIYMYVDSRKKWQSAFVHSNIKIQMRKLERRIYTQQICLQEGGNSSTFVGQEKIKELLLQIRDKRFLANQLKLADDDRDRKQKVKFMIAYVGCTLLELLLLMH
ncbi:MAG: hypothetical protein HUJ84_04705 [Veillonella sp.]|nr:hypothetical protein [Veillonella sp.]